MEATTEAMTEATCVPDDRGLAAWCLRDRFDATPDPTVVRITASCKRRTHGYASPTILHTSILLSNSYLCTSRVEIWPARSPTEHHDLRSIRGST